MDHRSVGCIHRVPRMVVIAMLGLAVTACASTGASNSSRSTDVITASELREVGVLDLYEAVRQLRPAWLTNLSGAYLDNRRLDAEELRALSSARVQRIELISSEAATARWCTRTLSGRFLLLVGL